MKLTHSPVVALTTSLFLLCATARPARAQVFISGNLSDSTTGPLLTGVVYRAAGNLNVPAGHTLTVQPGAVVKFNANSHVFDVHGTLVAQGTSVAPAIFTELRDDSAGGDTNGDGGASAPYKGNWVGLRFFTGSASSSLDYLEVRYAGSSAGGGSIEFSSSAPASMSHCTIRDGDNTGISVNAAAASSECSIRECAFVRNSNGGIDLKSFPAPLSVQGCSFVDNAGDAVDHADIRSVPGFVNNSAHGNHRNYMLISSGLVTSDLAIGAESCLGGALVSDVSVTVGSAATLTLRPGVVIKFSHGSSSFTVDGGLIVRGSADRPVVLTEIRDDAIGGDSNADGTASSPAKAAWGGLRLISTTFVSDVAHLLVRYSGAGSSAGIYSSSSLASLADCRVEHASESGFSLVALRSEARGLVAWDCNNQGINLGAAAFSVRQATSVANGVGFQKQPGWSGDVRDSIAWGNASANYTGFALGEVTYSCGLAGGLGNIGFDPLFVAAISGDVRLQPGSPCIDIGDGASPLDPDCSTADMGAIPFDHGSAPLAYCTGKLNSAGCVPFLAHDGYASSSSLQPFLVRAEDVVNNKSGLFFYGHNGPSSAPFQGGTKCVASPTLRLPIQSSGGSASVTDCSGTFVFDFNARIQSGVDPLLVAGATVDLQCWYRDPGSPSNTGLSNGLEFTVCN